VKEEKTANKYQLEDESSYESLDNEEITIKTKEEKS